MCCQPQSDFLNRINELPGGSKGCQACQFFRDRQTSCNCKKERFWEWWLVSTIWVGRNIKFIEQIFELDNPLKLQVTNASKCAPPNDNCPKNNRHWLTLLSSVVHSGGLPPRPSDELKTIKYHFQSEPEPKMCLFLFINTIYWLTQGIGDTLGLFWNQGWVNGVQCKSDGKTTVYEMIPNDVNSVTWLAGICP